MKLTVFTPTYNRAYLLPRLYESLLIQGFNDFEWLVIDDASTDQTEELIESWKEESPFSIRYYKQTHGGKHRALNKAFELAKGDYFFIVDSDDWLCSKAIEYIYSWIDEIDSNLNLAGVSGLKITNGASIGGNPITNNQNYIDASNFERLKYNLGGDKAEVYRTSILQKFPFPEFKGEYFVTEAVCWNAIANAGYKIRWYNKPIYNCNYLDDGLTKNGANDLKGHLNNYKGYCYYIKQLIDFQGLFTNPRILMEYKRTASFMKKSFREIASDIEISNLQAFFLDVFILFGFIKSGTIKLYRKLSRFFLK